MVRGAAKNHAHVAVLVDPADYAEVLDELRSEGDVSDATRRRLARRAFAHTAAYDAAIVAWFDEHDGADAAADDEGRAALPATLHLSATRSQELRYGENPHQAGARYSFPAGGCWDAAEQLNGKEMSYLNVYDADAAWRLVHSLGDGPAAVVIKHANPCGAAIDADITAAYVRAHEGDPTSAYGGIVALNRTVPVELAEALAPVFTEVVIAPAYDDAALELLTAKANLRVLTAPAPQAPALDIRTIVGRAAGADRRRGVPRPRRVAGGDRPLRRPMPSGATWSWPGASSLGSRRTRSCWSRTARRSASAQASRTAATPGASPRRRRPGAPWAARARRTRSSRSATVSTPLRRQGPRR